MSKLEVLVINYKLLISKIKNRGLVGKEICRNLLHSNTRLDVCIASRHNGLSHEEIMQLKSLLGLSSKEVMRIFFVEQFITTSYEVVCEKIALLELALRRFKESIRIIVQNVSTAKCLIYSISKVIEKVLSSDNLKSGINIMRNDIYPENIDETIKWYSSVRFSLSSININQEIDFISFPKLFSDVSFENNCFKFLFNNF